MKRIAHNLTVDYLRKKKPQAFSSDYYDMATGTVSEKRWENIVSYFTFTGPIQMKLQLKTYS